MITLETAHGAIVRARLALARSGRGLAYRKSDFPFPRRVRLDWVQTNYRMGCWWKKISCEFGRLEFRITPPLPISTRPAALAAACNNTFRLIPARAMRYGALAWFQGCRPHWNPAVEQPR
jgi:hypothetical protein